MLIKLEQIECSKPNAQQLDRQQQSQRSTHRIDHELERGVVTIGAAPLVDQEVHRHESHFPEDKEDQQVERHKDAEHACLEEEEEHHVPFDPVCNAE